MEKKNNNIFVIIILILIILGLGSFIVYDKILMKDSNVETNSNEKKSKINDNEKRDKNLEKLFAEDGYFHNYDIDGLKYYIENFHLQDLPFHIDKNGQLVKTYKMTDLTDYDLGVAVWNYTMRTSEKGLPKTISSNDVELFLAREYNLKNSKVKELNKGSSCNSVSCDIMDLKKEGDNYIINALATEFDLPDFRVEDISYDEKNNELNVYFFQFQHEITYSYRLRSGVAIYKIQGEIPMINLYLDRVQFN